MGTKVSKQAIVDFYDTHPDMSYRAIGEAFDISKQRVHQILKQAGRLEDEPIISAKPDVLKRFWKWVVG